MVRHGFSRAAAEELQKAKVAFQKGVDLKYKPPFSLYNLACANALSGDLSEALASLQQSVKIAPRLTLAAAKDSDLAALQGNSEF